MTNTKNDHFKRLTVRLDQELYAELEEICRYRGQSMTEFFRRCLIREYERFVATEKKDGD